MVIIGIDPGLAHTGWGVIEWQSDAWRARAYGCIDTKSTDSLTRRLSQIHEGIAGVIDQYQVLDASVEDVFFGTNARTAFSLGQARGSALLACVHCPGQVGEYSPNSIKQYIVGHGHADKDQIAYMVQMLLGLDHVPRPDHCSDALAVALTHGFTLKAVGHLRRKVVS